MTDDTEQPKVDEILYHTLMMLTQTRRMLSKQASSVGGLSSDSPLTHAQRQARTVTLDAIADAEAAIDRATGALRKTLGTDDPPRP